MTNSSESTGTFRRKLTSADASNIVSVLDMISLNGQYAQFEADFILGFAGMLESLQVSVGLFSLRSADFPAITPLMSEANKQAEIARIRTDGQKIGLSLWIAKGNGPWEYASECVLQNNANSESYVPLLVPFLTVNEVLLIDRDFRLGVKVESKWQGPLKVNDYLVISGSWRQRVTFTSKKNEDEVLAARLEALELALYGKLTNLPANSIVGSVAGGVATPIPLPLAIALGGNGVGSYGAILGHYAYDSIDFNDSSIPPGIVWTRALGDVFNGPFATNFENQGWLLTLFYGSDISSEDYRFQVLLCNEPSKVGQVWIRKKEVNFGGWFKLV